jgi:hypothetical protein
MLDRVPHFELCRANSLPNHALGELVGGVKIEPFDGKVALRQRARVEAFKAEVARMPSFERDGHAGLSDLVARL